MNLIHRPRMLTSLTLLAACTTMSCGSTSTDEGEPQSTLIERSSALMRRAANCEELEQALKDDVRARLEQTVQQEGRYYLGGDEGGAVMVEGPGVATNDGVGGFTATGGASGTSPPPPPPPSPGSGPDEYTQTNTQVQGIDEADFVKTDGQNIYVLRQNQLAVADAWPAEQLALTTTTEIEGSPVEMYVVGEADAPERKVVVYSQVDGVSLHQQAGLPVPQTDGDVYYPEPAYPGEQFYSPVPVTKVTVLTASASGLSVAHEIYYDGSYVSSRRNGNHIRTVLHMAQPSLDLSFYPDQDDVQKAEMMVIEDLLRAGRSVADISSEDLDVMVQDKLAEVMVSENEDGIEAISYQDWLPHVITRAADGLAAATVACEDFYIPLAGTSEQGITHVAQLNLEQLGTSQGRAVLGVATEMYENANTMVLASSTWDWPAEVPAGEFVEPQSVTYLHSFDVSDPQDLSYTASGIVDGSIYGQFALDEKDGSLRVVTTEEEWWSESVNHLFVLQAQDGELVLVGDAGPLAPGESVYSARFVGDTGYVVTFRQVDPLFVIDLSDPTQPTVLAALKIPGFSEYMHPMDDDHLLTVGRDADEATGWSENVALQIFDVTDRTNPLLMHRYVFDRAGSTEGAITHKAVTYFPERGLLALPFLAEEFTPDYSWYGMSSTMELFRVSLDQGIVPIGAIDGNVLRTNAEQPGSGYYCDPYYYGTNSTMLERGIFMDDVLYAVARNGIIAAPVSDPATPISVLSLSDPTEVPEYCWYEGAP